MVDLKVEDWELLKELERGPRTISGNQDRRVMGPLLEAGYVVEEAINLSVTVYTITLTGRAALKAHS